MISNLRPYPAYKDSGVPWLGQVPAHWEVRRLRYIVEMRVSNVDKHSMEGEEPVRLCNYVDVYKHERIRANMEFMKATASVEEIERFRLEQGDVLITKDSEAWDDIGVPALIESSAPDLISGYHLALLRPKQVVEGAFLLRALQSPLVAYQFHVEAKGVTRYGLSHDAIKSTLVPLPPLPEQTAIVRFLDSMDRRMRRYIRAKQKLIKLLEEYKQVLIHQAVTGKIDVRLPAPRPAAGMFCVYVLKCSDGSFYIGQTDNFPRRLREHCAGEVSWTASRLPVDPIHWEVFESREQAIKREHELKTGYGRQWLKREYVVGRLAAASRQAGTGKPYPAYKTSGVEWLGEVPAHWEVRRLKTVVDHVNE